MFTNSAGAKITQKVIQVEELFTSEFENPLKEKIKEVFDANFDSKLEKKFEKLKGDKGDALTEAEVAKIKEEIELKVHGSLLDFCQKEIQNYFKVESTSIQDSTNKSVNLISETFKKYQDELSTHIQSVEELKKQGSETLIKLNSFEIDYDKLIGKIDFEKLKGRDAVVDYKKLLNLIDFSELKGRDGTSPDLDYEFIKKELASLFEEWKANLGDLTGKQGERGEKGNDGLNGAEYPTYEKQLFSDDLIPVAKHKLPMTNSKAIVCVVGVSNLGTFMDLEENVIFQNLGGESKLLSKGRFNGVPSNSANLSYEINIVNGFLNILVAGKTNEIFDVKVVIR
jgi:hypothetical protein